MGLRTVPAVCRPIGMTLAACATLYIAYTITRRRLQIRTLYQKIQRRRAEREQGIKAVQLQLQTTSKKARNELQSLSFDQLRVKLSNGDVKVVDVLHAYQEAAITAHERTNCITQFVTEAEQWALDMDASTPEARKLMPLFGIPFSVKEELAIAGYDSTWGYAQRLFEPKKETNVMIRALMRLGAIPFVRTNVPQTLMSGACSNPIYGRSNNKHSKDRVPGGSSGGCGALLSMKGAIFGIGSDLGGSCRIPSHFSGTVGFKPTVERFSQWNTVEDLVTGACLISTFGIQGVDARAVQCVVHELYQAGVHDLDYYAAPVPWTPLASRPLRIGYFITDPAINAMPACRRAVVETIKKLEAVGHQIIQIAPPNVREGIELVVACAFDGDALTEILNKDIWEPDEQFAYPYYALGRYRRQLRACLRGEGRIMRQYLDTFADDVTKLRNAYARVGAFRNKMQLVWKEHDLDAIVCPPSVSLALLHGQSAKCMYAHSYTSIYNALGFPAGVVPVTKCQSKDVSQCRSDFDALPRKSAFDREMLTANGDDSAVGLPVAVQVAAAPFHDEMVLHVLNIIEKLNDQ